LKVALSTIEPTKPIKSLNAKKVMTVIMPMEIIGAGFGQAQKCGGVKLIKWIPFVLFLIISNGNIDINTVDPV
jgi:hypothetical protein